MSVWRRGKNGKASDSAKAALGALVKCDVCSRRAVVWIVLISKPDGPLRVQRWCEIHAPPVEEDEEVLGDG